MRRLILTLLLASASFPALAHDLGVQGKVFKVEEPNLVLYFLAKAARVDWQQKGKQLESKIDHKLHNMPNVGLDQAERTETHYIDPSITLQQDITAPIKQPDGSYAWKVVYHKGDRVNPLTRVQPVTRMLFFDPTDPKQKAFALSAKAAYPNRIMLVVTGGDIDDLSKQLGQPVFYALPFLVKKFNLKAVPALAGTGMGKYAYDLAVTTFNSQAISNPSEAPQVIRSAWYGLPDKKEKSR